MSHCNRNIKKDIHTELKLLAIGLHKKSALWSVRIRDDGCAFVISACVNALFVTKADGRYLKFCIYECPFYVPVSMSLW